MQQQIFNLLFLNLSVSVSDLLLLNEIMIRCYYFYYSLKSTNISVKPLLCSIKSTKNHIYALPCYNSKTNSTTKLYESDLKELNCHFKDCLEYHSFFWQTNIFSFSLSYSVSSLRHSHFIPFAIASTLSIKQLFSRMITYPLGRRILSISKSTYFISHLTNQYLTCIRKVSHSFPFCFAMVI